jgi:hypothetical protein
VFDFVAAERNEPLYNPRLERVELLTAGPIGAGTVPGRKREERRIWSALKRHVEASGELRSGPAASDG